LKPNYFPQQPEPHRFPQQDFPAVSSHFLQLALQFRLPQQASDALPQQFSAHAADALAAAVEGAVWLRPDSDWQAAELTFGVQQFLLAARCSSGHRTSRSVTIETNQTPL
jgi:hypothetical protein